MSRSFLTRLVDSVTRALLLALCLLTGLACATPFALENLEAGMTAETVREKFGEPEAIEIEPEGAEPSWTYLHEEQAWGPTVLLSSIALPPCILFTALMPFVGEHPCYTWNVKKESVVLQFSEGKVTSWEVLPDPRGSFWDHGGNYSGYDSQQSMFWTDFHHHQMGHKHHHGH